MMSRSPLFEDLPLGTIITDELRLQRLQDPKYFKLRKFSCPVCGELMEYSGSRCVDSERHELEQYLFYCKSCDANIEYTRLQP